jgi:hypothetical protein
MQLPMKRHEYQKCATYIFLNLERFEWRMTFEVAFPELLVGRSREKWIIKWHAQQATSCKDG